MRGGNDIIGGSTVKGKDGEAISVGSTVSCSGLFGSKTFTVKSIDAAKKGAPPSLVNPGNYAAAKCTKVDPNAPVKDKTGHVLKEGDIVTCSGTLSSPTFKIVTLEGSTGKVFDAKKNGYVGATKCTYQAPGMKATMKTDGKKSAIKVQIKEADITLYRSHIGDATGSILLGYTKKDGSKPVQFGGNMNPDGTLEEEGGALKTLTTLSTYILIFRDTIDPKEFESQVANSTTLKSKMNVDTVTTAIPSQYNELRAGLKGTSGKLTAIKIQINTANLTNTKIRTEIQKAAGERKIVGYTDKSGNNPVQLGGSLNPDGTLDEEGGALSTFTTLSTYIVIFDGTVDPLTFAKNVAASTTLKPLMNVDKALQTSVPASYIALTAGTGASGTETAVKIQIKLADLTNTKIKADIQTAAGHKILGYTDSKGAKPVQLGGSLTPDGTFDEEGGALSTFTTLSTYIVIFNGVVNVTAFASKVAANATLKKIMNVDTKLSNVPSSFNDLRAGTGASGTPSAIKIQINHTDLKANKREIEKEAGHTILGYTDKYGKKPIQLGGYLNPDGTLDEQGGKLAIITTRPTYIVIFNGVVNATAFVSKVAANDTLKKIMYVDEVLQKSIPASFTELASSSSSRNNDSSNTGSSAAAKEAAAVDAAASADTAAEAAKAVASTTSDPNLVEAAKAAAAKPGATPASVQRAVQAAASEAPAAAAPTLSEDPEDPAVCRLPGGEAVVKPPWEPVKDHPEVVALTKWDVPPSAKVNVIGISDTENSIHAARTQIGTKTLFYTFVLIKEKVFGITAAANNKNEAIAPMLSKMNKENGVIRVNTVTSDITKIVGAESTDSVEEMIDDLQAAIDTLLASPAADDATSRAIQQQVATHRKTMAALKIALTDYKKAAQSGGRRKSRRHYRKKLRSSRKRRHMRR